jgi:hypothetical protein
VSIAYKLIACLLLALWLPASAHCEMASLLGAFDEPCQSACDHAHNENGCTLDHCALIEDGNYTLSNASAKIYAPASAEPLDLLRLMLTVMPRITAVDATIGWRARPTEDWVRDWVFARRAAPPARAPGTN